MDASRKELLTREFTARFGSAPEVWVRAPGRVDLMGSHTDYNQGFVLTLSIDRDTWIAARPRADDRVCIQSLELPCTGEFDLGSIEHDTEAPWTNYVRGVASELAAAGCALLGFEGLIHSTVPLRSGLSSSAALEVAAALLFEALGGWQLDRVELARLCQRAENRFVGMSCGILDQYTSALGRAGCALLLDCRELTSRAVPLHAEIGVVICDTRCKRELTGSEYPERRAQCEQGARELSRYDSGITALRDVTPEKFESLAHHLPDGTTRRCRFIVEENARVLALAGALEHGDGASVRALTDASFTGARDLFEIVTPEMEMMRSAMLRAPGVIGGRQAGAGFGGCTMAFVERARVAEFTRSVQNSYHAASGIPPAVYPVEAAAGAGLLTA